MNWTNTLYGAAAMLLMAPAMAQTPDRAAPSAPPPALNKRLDSFTMRNMASKAIEQASVHMTNGQTANVTAPGRIMPNEAQSFGANNGGCLDAVSVQFAGGATLAAQNLNECNASTIVVRDDKITTTSSAAPGGRTVDLPSNH